VLPLGWFFIVFGAFIIVGAGNAVNLTDGLDGLATVPVIIVALSFGFISYLAGQCVLRGLPETSTTSRGPASWRCCAAP